MTLAGIGLNAFQLAAGPPHERRGSNLSPPAFGLPLRRARDLGELVELSEHDPAAADQLVSSLVSHLRSARPESVSSLGMLPPPGEVARAPRRTW